MYINALLCPQLRQEVEGQISLGLFVCPSIPPPPPPPPPPAIHFFYAPAYLKNSGRALSVTPVRPSVHLYVPFSCPGHNSKTLRNIFMKLHRCIHHSKRMCHEQGRQHLHFWFLNYFPLTRFHIVNRVQAITPKLYGIYSWNFTSAYITLIRCVMNKEDNLYFLFLNYLPLS